MADAPEVMNIRQASEYLGVSPDTLYKYVYEEKIPAFKLGNRWKFKKTILDSWMERKSTVGEGKAKKRPRAARAVAGVRLGPTVLAGAALILIANLLVELMSIRAARQLTKAETATEVVADGL